MKVPSSIYTPSSPPCVQLRVCTAVATGVRKLSCPINFETKFKFLSGANQEVRSLGTGGGSPPRLRYKHHHRTSRRLPCDLQSWGVGGGREGGGEGGGDGGGEGGGGGFRDEGDTGEELKAKRRNIREKGEYRKRAKGSNRFFFGVDGRVGGWWWWWYPVERSRKRVEREGGLDEFANREPWDRIVIFTTAPGSRGGVRRFFM